MRHSKSNSHNDFYKLYKKYKRKYRLAAGAQVIDWNYRNAAVLQIIREVYQDHNKVNYVDPVPSDPSDETGDLERGDLEGDPGRPRSMEFSEGGKKGMYTDELYEQWYEGYGEVAEQRELNFGDIRKDPKVRALVTMERDDRVDYGECGLNTYNASGRKTCVNLQGAVAKRHNITESHPLCEKRGNRCARRKGGVNIGCGMNTTNGRKTCVRLDGRVARRHNITENDPNCKRIGTRCKKA